MSIQTQFQTPEIFKAATESLSLKVYEDGAAATLSDASYVLYDQGTTEKATGSITPSSNTLTVSVASTVFPVVLENCRIKWTFTVSSVEYTFQNHFDVVASKIVNPVIQADLEKNHPNLSDDLWSGETNFQTQIDKAFDYVRGRIKNKGLRAHLIIDAEQIKTAIEWKAMELIFFDFVREPNDQWDMRYQEAKAAFEEEFSSINFVYDTGDDGVADTQKRMNYYRMKR